ncbi:MAG: basic secretory family protein [Fimbriimonadaceae bacterium]|nr:basic secretory family protein [Fimbriimonadaceae bacterium]
MLTASSLALVLSLVGQAPAVRSLETYVYPLAKAMNCPPVEIDVTEVPAAKQWALAASALVQDWYPKITQLLATDGWDPLTRSIRSKPFEPPEAIKLIFKKELDVPAYASGGTITINGKWITQHPDDLGMVVHELTHVIQNYGGRRVPGWLVEGIADYIRWWRYEPELHAGPGRTKINPDKAKYTDSYRTTAMWLAWLSRRYDMRLVPALDNAMRDGEDPVPLFKKLTGKEPEELFKEFVAAQK